MMVLPSNFIDVMEDLRGCTLCSVDTETTGLEWSDTPFAVIIGLADREYYFDEGAIPDLWDSSDFKMFLQNPMCTYIFQNAKFDMKMLGRKGIDVRGRIVDIAIMARLIRNDHWHPKAYSLDGQAQRELGKPKDDKVKKYIAEHDLYELRVDMFGEETKQPRYDRVPMPIMHEYACTDARLTYDLYKHYLPKMDEGSRKVWEYEVALTPICLAMEERGLLLDYQYTMKSMYAEEEKINALKADLKENYGLDYTNSAKHFEPWFNEHGITLPRTIDKKTKQPTKNPCLDDNVLESIIRTGDIELATRGHILAGHAAKLIQDIRHYEKRISTYYKPYLNFQDDKHVIHPTMWQAGTSTGRFSYSDPNLQNIPKKEAADEAAIRGCFIPRPGTKYVSIDYAQQEYRMMAAYAAESKVIKEVMEGKDFHQSIADMFGIPRDPAKTLNFAVLYGAGIDKIASMLKMPVEAAKRMKTGYFLALPKVEKFIDAVINVGKSRGYVTNWLGRKLHADREFCYALPNHLIQSGGADVVKVAMVRIGQAYPTIPLVLQIHDQLVFEMTDEQMAHIPGIRKIMEDVFHMNGMSLKVDISISDKSLADRDMVKYVG